MVVLILTLLSPRSSIWKFLLSETVIISNIIDDRGDKRVKKGATTMKHAFNSDSFTVTIPLKAWNSLQRSSEPIKVLFVFGWYIDIDNNNRFVNFATGSPWNKTWSFNP